MIDKPKITERRRALLEGAGIELHGVRWVELLAIDLGVSSKTVYRWHNGITRMPASVDHELMRLLREKRAKITVIIEKLSDHARDHGAGFQSAARAQNATSGP